MPAALANSVAVRARPSISACSMLARPGSPDRAAISANNALLAMFCAPQEQTCSSWIAAPILRSFPYHRAKLPASVLGDRDGQRRSLTGTRPRSIAQGCRPVGGCEGVTPSGQTKTFYGWRIVAAVFVLATFGWGLGFYGPPVYLHAVREARGWSVTIVSAAVTAHFLFGAIVIANLPRLYRRFGVARVTKFGSIAAAAGIAGWAIAREPWQLFALTLLSGGGWVTMGAAAVNAIIAPWFVRKRPAALTAAYNGSSIGGVVFSPLWVAAIGLLGFPWAAIAIGLVVVATIWTLARPLLLQNAGNDGALSRWRCNVATILPASSAKPLPKTQVWKDWRLVTLAACMALSLFA